MAEFAGMEWHEVRAALVEVVRERAPEIDPSRVLREDEEGRLWYRPQGESEPEEFQVLRFADLVSKKPPGETDSGADGLPPDVVGYYSHGEGILASFGAPEGSHELGPLPPTVDRCGSPHQSPVRHQGNRNTCVAFAAIAQLEGEGQLGPDLSEQFTHFLFVESSQTSQHGEDRGVPIDEAAEVLSRQRTSDEGSWRYVTRLSQLLAAISSGAYFSQAAAVANREFGIQDGAARVLRRTDLFESVDNPRYLEALIAAGHDVVIGLSVPWVRGTDGIYRPANVGTALQAGHAVLLVGYDSAERTFCAKNSYGRTFGEQGYMRLSYDYAPVGFVVGYWAGGFVGP